MHGKGEGFSNADANESRWPDKAGTVQKLTGVVGNHVVDVFEGDDKPKYK